MTFRGERRGAKMTIGAARALIRGRPLVCRALELLQNNSCIPSERAILSGLLDKLSISRLGESSVESVFSDDLKPDDREQSVKEQ
jgi:hypothetical protein